MFKRVIEGCAAAKAAVPQVLARLRRKRRQWRELRLLDPEAFRDLGVDRSELGSFEAEAMGAAACTRRRVSIRADAGNGSE